MPTSSPQDLSNPLFPAVQPDGIWAEIRPGAQTHGPALFLDRDGVVVEEVNYLSNPKDVALVPGAAEIIVAANRQAVPVVIVTNQAGIAYGYYGWREFDAVQQRMLELLAAQSAAIDAVFACPFHAKGETPWGGHPDHPARKPNPGMLLRAAALMPLDLKKSWIVGDRATDLEAGLKAGLAGGLHVASGHGSREGERDKALATATTDFQVTTGVSIADARALPLLSSS